MPYTAGGQFINPKNIHTISTGAPAAGAGGPAPGPGQTITGSNLAPYAGGAGPVAGNTQHVQTPGQSYLFAQPFDPKTMVSYLFGGLPGFTSTPGGDAPAAPPGGGAPPVQQPYTSPTMTPQQMAALTAMRQRFGVLGNGNKGY